MPESELERVLHSSRGHWQEITARNGDHFNALKVLLRDAFENAVYVLGEDGTKNRVYTYPLPRARRKALEKTGYKVRSCTNDPGP